MLVLETSSHFFGHNVLHQATKYRSIYVEMRTSLSYLSSYHLWFPGLSRTAMPSLELASPSDHPHTFVTEVFSTLRLTPDDTTLVSLSLQPNTDANNFLSTILDMNVRSPGLSAAIDTLQSYHLDVYFFLTRPRPILVVFFQRGGLFGGFWAQASRTWRAQIFDSPRGTIDRRGFN